MNVTGVGEPKLMAAWNEGYTAALEDLLNDECFYPIIVEAREMLEKKARLADS